jgi:hypothetical protein
LQLLRTACGTRPTLFGAAAISSGYRGTFTLMMRLAVCKWVRAAGALIFSFGYRPGVSNRRHRSRLTSRQAIVRAAAPLTGFQRPLPEILAI